MQKRKHEGLRRARVPRAAHGRWAKFFLPVYEKDRVFMLKCGDPPTIGYLDDDDW